MNRYTHEDETFTPKKQTKRFSEKQLIDKRKYRERRNAQENADRNCHLPTYPEPEENGVYRP